MLLPCLLLSWVLAPVLREERVDWEIWLIHTGHRAVVLADNGILLEVLIWIVVDSLLSLNGGDSILLTTLLVHPVGKLWLVHEVRGLVPDALPRHVFLVVARPRTTRCFVC